MHVPVGETDLTLLSALIEGKPVAAFRPIVEVLGLGYSTQIRKLKGKSWACMVKMTTHDASGRIQDTGARTSVAMAGLAATRSSPRKAAA